MLGQQLLTGSRIQPSEAQGAYQRVPALQGAQGGGFLSRSEQQATLVRRFAYPPQQVSIRFKAGTQPSQHLAFFQQHFQVIEHQ